MMRVGVLLFTIAIAVPAPAASPVPPGDGITVTVPKGVPLRVALEHRVAIKHVGEPIQGRLVEPVYVFDRVALSAGSVVEGHVAEIGGVPVARRIAAILSGNFTPQREVRAQFDSLVLSDGSRLSLRTSLSCGTAHTVRISNRPKKQEESKSTFESGRDRIEDMNRAAILAFTAPGKMSRLKATLSNMLPYHRQAWSAGTLFNGVLQEPLTAPAPSNADMQTEYPASAEAGDREVSARLLTPISSTTARKGTPIEAVVTRPLFAPDHSLLIPEGSRLFGEVVQAQPARFLHRNGRLFFVFRKIELPPGVQNIQGYLVGVEADFNAHLAVDPEGATRASSPKTRFIFPAIAVAVAGLSFHQDYNSQGVPDHDWGGRAESGAVGLGAIGTLVAQAARPLASSIAIAGAGFSVYSTFIARGVNVVLPANTPVKVGIKNVHGTETGVGQPVK